MDGIKKKCKQLEKEKYWREFESTRHQFFKIMFGDFVHQLRIPKWFASNFREQLSDTILLRGPSGYTWLVRLARSGDDWSFVAGWAKFVQDHGLEPHDLLIFRYNGNSSFKVVIFNKTGCEREGSYFVKAPKRLCSERYCAMNDGNESFIGVNIKEKHIQQMTSKRKENTTCHRKKKKLQRSDEVDSLETSESSGEEDSVEPIETNELQINNRSKKMSRSQEAQIGSGSPEGLSSKRTSQKTYSLYLISKRRQVSEEEKKRAFESACQHRSTRSYFLMVMKSTNVRKYFAVNIPRNWGTKHLPETNNLEIQLSAPPGEKRWPVLLKSTPWKLAKGWYRFVRDNNLEKDDVCIFELNQGGKTSKEPIIFDVIIHRVVDEIVPLTIAGR